MAEIILTPDAEATLQNLIEVLYKKEYFGFRESCRDYAAQIYDFCATLPQQRHRKTINNKHGEWYCRYSHSRRTHWFIIFDVKNDRYIIRHIINNFSSDYPQFVANL